MFSACSSNYFFKRSPGRFGARQDDYLRQVDETVTTTANRIRQIVKEENGVTPFFHEILQFLGSIRQNIAREHGTANWEMYGTPRDGRSSIAMYTSLCEVYEEYNNRLLPKLQNHLRTMQHTFKGVQTN